MIKIKTSRRKPGIPMSAMSDIGFLLLIFVMLLSLINNRFEVKIDYPEALKIEKTDDEKNMEIWIQKDGLVFSQGKQISRKALEGLIAETLARDPETRIHVIADRNTPYKHIDGVVSVLQTLQHRVVSFVIEERNK